LQSSSVVVEHLPALGSVGSFVQQDEHRSDGESVDSHHSRQEDDDDDNNGGGSDRDSINSEDDDDNMRGCRIMKRWGIMMKIIMEVITIIISDDGEESQARLSNTQYGLEQECYWT
jgi:hypothetical protein